MSAEGVVACDATSPTTCRRRNGRMCAEHLADALARQREYRRKGTGRAATSRVCDQPHCDNPTTTGTCRSCREARACNESPLALTGGRWVSRRGIQVWEAGS